VPTDTLTSWGFGEGSAGPAEDSEKQDARSITGLAQPPPFDPQRAGAADGILQQLEDHRIPDGEIVERRAFLEVAPMEIDLATVRETDEAVALSNEQLDDAAR
jgi:hypothetical protein